MITTKSVVGFIILFVFIAGGISCKKESPISNGPITGGSGAPELDSAFSSAAQILNLKSLVVYKEDRILREVYFGGTDSNTTFDVRSVTKSVMATLIGIAIDKGVIPSEQQTIGSYQQYYPRNIDSITGSIKIRDLLSMSSGFSGNELNNPAEFNAWFNAPDQVDFTLGTPVTDKPGTVFNYHSGSAHLTSAILTVSSGLSTIQFARQYLFQPLGIADHPWQTDKQGIYNGAAGLFLTSHDMINIGKLYLNHGLLNGIQIVSEEWITKAASQQILTNNAQPFGPGYGYFWWIGSIHGHQYFFANGYGGQFIVVVPDLRLVVAATNQWSGVPPATANGQWYNTLDIIMNQIIPAY